MKRKNHRHIGMAPNLCRVHWPYLPRILPYCWLSLCTFYATLLPHCFADAAVIRNYRDNHTYSQNLLCQQTPYWTKVNRTWFCPRMRPKWTQLNQTEPNRKRVWPVKITPIVIGLGSLTIIDVMKNVMHRMFNFKRQCYSVYTCLTVIWSSIQSSKKDWQWNRANRALWHQFWLAFRFTKATKVHNIHKKSETDRLWTLDSIVISNIGLVVASRHLNFKVFDYFVVMYLFSNLYSNYCIPPSVTLQKFLSDQKGTIIFKGTISSICWKCRTLNLRPTMN